MSGETSMAEPAGRMVAAARLEEVRLRVDPRFASRELEASFRQRRVPAAANWLRAHGATRLLDLKVFPPSAAGSGWHGRASVPAADVPTLLSHSGDDGFVVSPAKRTGYPCWLPAETTLENAQKLAAEYDGRIIANRVGLGVCVADFDNARPLYIKALGEKNAGTKGCPTFEIIIDAGLDPASFGDVVAERRQKHGKRRVWLRVDHPKDADTSPTWKVPVSPPAQPANTDATTLDMDVDPDAAAPAAYKEISGAKALPPRKPSYASVARRKRRKGRKEEAYASRDPNPDAEMTDAADDAAEAADFFGVPAATPRTANAANAPSQTSAPNLPK
eukprot:Rhum_TRINITY_DN14859_c0_g1::Rhum_TRINITY_DN14859_c0_g1_i2::g.122348::m.122348